MQASSALRPTALSTSARRGAMAGGLAVALLVAACGNGGSVASSTAPIDGQPRRESAQTSGNGDRLAAELLLSAGGPQANPLRPAFAMTDPPLAAAIANRALDHLRSNGLGAAAGTDLLGSQRLRRLASAEGAPVDGNGNGTNLDEVLAADVARLAAYVGAAVPTGLYQPLLPWAEASADLAAPTSLDLPQRFEQWRTKPAGSRVVRLVDVAGAMHARVQAASALLPTSRGGLPGATADDGVLGMLLLGQALALEEELVSTLSTDGSGVLGRFDDPHTYDPAQGRRWLPAEIEAVDVGNAIAYRLRDGASDLTTLASLLDATAELAWFAGAANPATSVHSIFTTGPFAPPPPRDPPEPVLSWQVEIRPIIHGNCGGCHLGFPTGGFLVDTYATLANGSPRTRSIGPMLVPGNHNASFLHRILVNPPFPIQRMPPGIGLPQATIAAIDAWIDAGALENPPVVPPPPTPGQDLGAVLFANLVAMHFDPASGALDCRHEGDGTAGIATAAATGRALSALAHLAPALPTLQYGGRSVLAVLQQAATFAAEHLVDDAGRGIEQVDLTTLAGGRGCELADQAVLTAGLLDAAARTGQPVVGQVAARAAAQLIESFRAAGDDWFAAAPGHAFARYTPGLLADVLAALRAAVAAAIPGAPAAHDRLLARLLPVLAYAAWPGDGTPAAGLPTPAQAGGEFGRLPLLTGAILVGSPLAAAPADAPLTWSQHVRPLLLAKCADCHLGGSRQGNYHCDTVAALQTPGDSGGAQSLLVPGDPDHSFFYRKLVDRLPATGAQMPFQRALLDERGREIVRRWIADGASRR